MQPCAMQSTQLVIVCSQSGACVVSYRTGVSYNYRDMLMNFVCNLRRLKLFDSLVIAVRICVLFNRLFSPTLHAPFYPTIMGHPLHLNLPNGHTSRSQMVQIGTTAPELATDTNVHHP
jgi:hypothetical protein